MTVRATYTTFDNTVKQSDQSTTYKVCYKNPCVDPAYTKIVAPDTVAEYEYIITNPQLNDNVPAFSLVTQPDATHGLCGDIEYKFLVDGLPVPTTPDASNPVGYDPNGPRKIGIESSNPDDEGTKKYKIIASLKDYPEDNDPDTNPPVVEREGDIDLISPCPSQGTVEA